MGFYSIVMTVFCIVLLIVSIVSINMYQQAIQQGAKNVVTALEMVVACQQLSNVTNQQILEQSMHNYIQNKTGGQ